MKEELNVNGLKDEFGSVRFITVLTPDTFTRDMIVISTVYQSEANQGETAIGYAKDLNSLTIDFTKLDYKIIKKHSSLEEAFNFHITEVNKKKFGDCKKSI